MYQRKTADEYIIQGNYGSCGWEDEVAEDTMKEARERLKEYRQNSQYASRLIKRRVPIAATPYTGRAYRLARCY